MTPAAAWLKVIAPLAAALAWPAVASSSAPHAAALSRCHTRDLAGSLRQGSPGAGQRYAVLVLRNHTSHSCTVRGYVGMLLLDSHGHGLPTRVVRDSAKPKRVLLAPGSKASTLLHWTAVPSPPEPMQGACEPNPARVEVTPPDETAHLVLHWRLGAVCDQGRIDILRLRSGTRGF